MDFATIDRTIENGLRHGFPLVWRHKILFTSSFFVLFAAIMLATLGLQPKYEGSTFLLARLNPLPENGSRNSASSDSVPQATQLVYVQIANSDEVVRHAAETVGLSRLIQSAPPSDAGLFLHLRTWIFGAPLPQQSGATAIDALLPRLKAALDVKAEPNSQIIRISYRHSDPRIASEFANALAQRLIERQIKVYSRPGAAAFFQQQRQRFDKEYQQASNELTDFAISTGTYSVEDQRKLLLGRISELKTSLAASRGSIVRQAAQRRTLGDELRHIAPVARSPWVSALVDNLAGSQAPNPAPNGSVPLNDPPLLLVRVYQDSMVDLFKINSDIAGSQAAEAEQLKELAIVTEDLNSLMKNAQRFAQLQRKVNQAVINADIYGKRMDEEVIKDASNVAEFSSLTVVQPALVPLRPIFPNYVAIFAASIVVSILGALGIILLYSALWRWRS